MESTFSTMKYFLSFTWIQHQDIHVSQCTQTQPQLAKIKPVSRKLMHGSKFCSIVDLVFLKPVARDAG